MRFPRNLLSVALLLLVGLGVAELPAPANAATTGGANVNIGAGTFPSDGIELPPLRERLTFGLLARRPSELAFLDGVIFAVEQGRLSEKLVDRTFFWARRRAPTYAGEYIRRPIIYFQPALQVQADKLGVDLTPPPSP